MHIYFYALGYCLSYILVVFCCPFWSYHLNFFLVIWLGNLFSYTEDCRELSSPNPPPPPSDPSLGWCVVSPRPQSLARRESEWAPLSVRARPLWSISCSPVGLTNTRITKLVYWAGTCRQRKCPSAASVILPYSTTSPFSVATHMRIHWNRSTFLYLVCRDFATLSLQIHATLPANFMTTIFIWPRVALGSGTVHFLVFFGDEKVARVLFALVLVERAFRPIFNMIKIILSACSNGPFCWFNVGNG